MKEQKLYKIRRNIDGLFSKGGNHIHPSFTESGKIWRGLGPLRNHFALVTDTWEKYKGNAGSHAHPYEECEVVEIQMVVLSTIPAMEEIIGSFERKKAKDQKYRRNLH